MTNDTASETLAITNNINELLDDNSAMQKKNKMISDHPL